MATETKPEAKPTTKSGAARSKMMTSQNLIRVYTYLKAAVDAKVPLGEMTLDEIVTKVRADHPAMNVTATGVEAGLQGLGVKPKGKAKAEPLPTYPELFGRLVALESLVAGLRKVATADNDRILDLEQSVRILSDTGRVYRQPGQIGGTGITITTQPPYTVTSQHDQAKGEQAMGLPPVTKEAA